MFECFEILENPGNIVSIVCKQEFILFLVPTGCGGREEGLCCFYGFAAGDDKPIITVQQPNSVELDPCTAVTSDGHGTCRT